MTCSSTVYDVYNPLGDVCSLSSVDNEELLKENSAVGRSSALILYYCVFITFHCRRCVRKFINNSPVVKGDSITAYFNISGSVSSVVCCHNPAPESGNKCTECELTLY